MSLTATRVSVELWRAQPEIARAGEALRTLQAAAERSGLDVVPTSAYVGASPWLVFWGPGNPERGEAMRRHVAAGGHVIALDLAYWSRGTKVRLSIDAPHPQAWVMRKAWPCDRFEADPPPMGNLWNPHGPIIVAGLGRKAKIQYGPDTIEHWEAEMMAACRARWPDRKVVYRPKPTTPGGPPIDVELRGASLVITWHSNAAVDAIRLGIPVVCRDGAAAAVCPSELPENPQPLPVAVRDKFLGNLAWFQWAPDEATQCWAFLREVLA